MPDDQFIGEIRNFGFTFAPRGWAFCDGSLLAISQNTALFSLLGTTYGGDGRTTFALPDLRGRSPLGFGQGPGLSSYAQGQVGGQEQVALTGQQGPRHNHAVAASSTATTKNPAGAVPAVTTGGSSYGTTQDLSMSTTMTGTSGDGLPHENRSPYLVTNWCIAVEGIFPSRS